LRIPPEHLHVLVTVVTVVITPTPTSTPVTPPTAPTVAAAAATTTAPATTTTAATAELPWDPLLLKVLLIHLLELKVFWRHPLLLKLLRVLRRKHHPHLLLLRLATLICLVWRTAAVLVVRRRDPWLLALVEVLLSHHVRVHPGRVDVWVYLTLLHPGHHPRIDPTIWPRRRSTEGDLVPALSPRACE
jgi:hypothetical protein